MLTIAKITLLEQASHFRLKLSPEHAGDVFATSTSEERDRLFLLLNAFSMSSRDWQYKEKEFNPFLVRALLIAAVQRVTPAVEYVLFAA